MDSDSAGRHRSGVAWVRRMAVLASCLVVTACGNDGGNRLGRKASPQEQARHDVTADMVALESPAAAPPPAPSAPSGAGGVSSGPSGLVPAGPTVPATRKVIRNGSMRVEVSSVDTALDALRAAVSAAGGYLAGESRSQNDGQARQASVTCRVPAERLDEVIGKIKGLGREEAVDLTAEDISEQYYDLEIRLRTQQQLEARLRDLLNRPSNRLADLLEIEREVARVRTEIDQMEGRKRFWDQQAALSTLTVVLHEPRPLVSTNEGGVWRTLRLAFGEAADNFVDAVAGIIAAIGALVPVVVALGLVFLALRALWRVARRRRPSA